MFKKSLKSTVLVFVLLVTMAFSSLGVYAQTNTIPTRDEIEDKYKWKLEDIYETDEAWEKDYKRLEDTIPSIEKYKGKLHESPDHIVNCIQLVEKVHRLNDKLNVYASMRSDEDYGNDKYKAMANKGAIINSNLYETISFIEPELLSISEDKLKKYFDNESLKDYDLYLKNLLNFKAHSLSEGEEGILASTGELSSTPENVYEAFKYVDRKIGKIQGEDGKEITVSPAEYSRLLNHSNRDMRKKAFEVEFNSYKEYINLLAESLAGEVKSNIFYAKTRNYNSALEAALAPNNIKPEVYNSLIEAVNNNLKPLHRYVSLRKKILGIEDKVHYYDMYVPMINSVSSNIPYEDAKKMVMEALNPLGEKYIEDLEIAFDSRWIDVYETQNKYSGGYSWGAYDTHPYVLLNYNGTLSEVSTLAHEMGHALNTYYTNQNQPYIKSAYPIFTAEVASTTNEAIMYDYLIKNAETTEEKIYLIGSYLEQIRGSIYTQLMYAEFEKIIHEAVESGETLTASFLNESWGNLMKKYYGEDFEVDELVKVWWSRIPHFYWNFYVYQYATGLSAGIKLSDNIVNGGEEEREAYLEFLGAGASDYPVELLQNAGVDMSTTEPVEKALEKFDELLTELEKLLEE
ncbi:oligoendopeptidase F [Maledivibacter halophilus]|uniref:Oligopeptidase F n=1 Tax=Maledivibacter halophilus TaxID=36842 RepID=A0A1T5JSH0_9FIRM|nr:oligoendopeptidase F [Maledivibacter halophilus]SKC54188.1 oligoendopeptidase F [Maledivibacter halophilus]